MATRRLAFAAPLVLVVASCGRPVPVPAPAPAPAPSLPIVAVPTDAAPIDAAPDADLRPPSRCGDPRVTCNPPPPCAVAPTYPHCTGGPPPVVASAPVFARVIKLEARGDHDTQITLSVGTAQGIGDGWTAELLVGDTQRALAGGQLKIVMLSRSSTIVVAHLPTDAFEANHRVRLAPPKPSTDR